MGPSSRVVVAITIGVPPSRSWCAQRSVVRRVADTSRTTINERKSRPGWPPSSGATTPPRPPSIGGSPPVTSTTSLACIDGHEQAPITQAARLRVTSTTSVGVCRVLRAHRDQSPPQQLGRLALQQVGRYTRVLLDPPQAADRVGLETRRRRRGHAPIVGRSAPAGRPRGRAG